MVKLDLIPKGWPKTGQIGVLLRRWTGKIKIPEYNFFGNEDDEDIYIEVNEPYWEVKLISGEVDLFREDELEKIV